MNIRPAPLTTPFLPSFLDLPATFLVMMSLSRDPRHASARLPALAVIVTLSILGCAGYPSTRRWLLFAPICTITFYFVFLTKTSDKVMDYAIGSWLATNVFVMSEFLLLPSSSTSSTQQRKELSRFSFAKRLKKGFDLFAAARGPGLEGQQQHALHHRPQPHSPSMSRGRGVLKQLTTLAQCTALYVAGDVAMQCNPSFETKGPPFHHQPRWLQPTVLGHTLTARASINGSYCVAAIFSIALGLSGPDEWPPLFGSFIDAYTVHNSWGNVWHQMMRRFLTRHTAFVARAVGIRNATAEWTFKLYFAFFISATIHYVGDHVLLRNWTGGSMKFFMLQPLAITVEHIVAAIMKGAGIRLPPSISRTVGYLWVLCWFTATMPIWVEPVVREGFLEDGWHLPVVYSIGRSVRSYLGVP